MKIYETGKSLQYAARGDENLPKDLVKTYVCIINPCNDNLQDAFDQMVDQLGPDKTNVDFSKLSVTTPKGIHILSHELSYDKKGNKVLKPSNILRYLFTRTFTIDTLYRNEDGEIVDIADAITDIQNYRLNTIRPFGELISYDNEILFEAIYLSLLESYRLGNTIQDALMYFPKSVKPLTKDNYYFNKMVVEHDLLNSINQLARNYNGLYNYLHVISGMKLVPLLAGESKYMEEYEKAYKEFLQKPQIAAAPPRRDPSIPGSGGLSFTSGSSISPIPPRSPRPRSFNDMLNEELHKGIYNPSKRHTPKKEKISEVKNKPSTDTKSGYEENDSEIHNIYSQLTGGRKNAYQAHPYISPNNINFGDDIKTSHDAVEKKIDNILEDEASSTNW